MAGPLASIRPSRAMIREWLPWGWKACWLRPPPMSLSRTFSPGRVRASDPYGWLGRMPAKLAARVSTPLRPLMNQNLANAVEVSTYWGNP